MAVSNWKPGNKTHRTSTVTNACRQGNECPQPMLADTDVLVNTRSQGLQAGTG